MPYHLPPSLYRKGDLSYRSGPDWIEVFSLKPELPRADEGDDPRELVLPLAALDFDAPSPSRRARPSDSLAPLVHWVTRTGGTVHRHSVRASEGPSPSYDGPAFVGRAFCQGQLLAGKVVPQERKCFVAYDGSVFGLARYEVLAVERGRVEWVPCRNGYVPPSAIPSGLTLQAIKIYTARAWVEGTVILGQIVKGERYCRIPHEKQELLLKEYDVLTLRCEGDNRPGPSEIDGPTDAEWNEWVRTQSFQQLKERDQSSSQTRLQELELPSNKYDNSSGFRRFGPY